MTKKTTSRPRPKPKARRKSSGKPRAVVSRVVDPEVVVEGLEVLIARDLSKHKIVLERTQQELLAYTTARTQEIGKKKHYRRQIGGGKFDDDALRKSMDQIRINIRHLSDKVDLAKEKIRFETNIVDTLTKQLASQDRSLRALEKYRRDHAVPN